jgi:rhomboid protease GluP
VNPDYRPYGTWTILLACLIVFVQFGLSQSTDDYGSNYLEAGAATPALVATGQWWRLLTANFVHFGFFHILMNGIGIYYLGPRLEFELGLRRYLTLFLVSGTVGGAFAVLLYPPYVSMAGASGGLFGMLGAYMAIGVRSGQGLGDYFQSPAGRSMGSILLINLVYGLVVPQISLAGHIGGFLAGLCLCLFAFRLGRLPIRRTSAFATWLCFLFCLIYTLHPVHRTWFLGRQYWLSDGVKEQAFMDALLLRVPPTQRGPIILLQEFRNNQRKGTVEIHIQGGESIVAVNLWEHWGIPIWNAKEMAEARELQDASKIPLDPWKP